VDQTRSERVTVNKKKAEEGVLFFFLYLRMKCLTNTERV